MPFGSAFSPIVPFSKGLSNLQGNKTKSQQLAVDLQLLVVLGSWEPQRNPAQAKGRAAGAFGFSKSHSLGAPTTPQPGLLDVSGFPPPVEKSHRIGFRSLQGDD